MHAVHMHACAVAVVLPLLPSLPHAYLPMRSHEGQGPAARYTYLISLASPIICCDHTPRGGGGPGWTLGRNCATARWHHANAFAVCTHALCVSQPAAQPSTLLLLLLRWLLSDLRSNPLRTAATCPPASCSSSSPHPSACCNCTAPFSRTSGSPQPVARRGGGRVALEAGIAAPRRPAAASGERPHTHAGALVTAGPRPGLEG